MQGQGRGYSPELGKEAFWVKAFVQEKSVLLLQAKAPLLLESVDFMSSTVFLEINISESVVISDSLI